MRVAILVLISSWGCAGDGKPGPVAPGETGDPGGGALSPRGGLGEVPGVEPSDTGGDSDTAVQDTSGPELWVLADNDPKGTGHHTMRRHVSGEGQILDSGASFEGTVEYWYMRDGEVQCDAEIALTGTADGASCEGCDYVFAIDAEVVRDDGTEHCHLANGWTFVGDDEYFNEHLAFATDYVMYGWAGSYETYHDVLLSGVGFDFTSVGGDGVYPGPYFYPAIFDGPYLDWGELWSEDDTMRWYYNYQAYDFYTLNHYNGCGSSHPSHSSDSYLEGTRVSGQVDCGQSYVDGWAFEASAGDTLTVSVDAPILETGFNPLVFVNGPDGCTVAQAWENYVCTGLASIHSTAKTCGSTKFTVDTDGLYEIWISSLGTDCFAGAVDYTLYVNLLDDSAE